MSLTKAYISELLGQAQGGDGEATRTLYEAGLLGHVIEDEFTHLDCDLLHCRNMEIKQHVECPVIWYDQEERAFVSCACPHHADERREVKA